MLQFLCLVHVTTQKYTNATHSSYLDLVSTRFISVMLKLNAMDCGCFTADFTEQKVEIH